MRTPEHVALYNLARRRRLDAGRAHWRKVTTRDDAHGMTYGGEPAIGWINAKRHRERAMQDLHGLPMVIGRRAE